jgi:hypothetical protein
MTLNPIAIATIGYVCNSLVAPIPIATHGYVCPAPVGFTIFDGDGGTGGQRREAELLMSLAPGIVAALEELDE